MDPGTTHDFASDALSGISVGLACGDGELDVLAAADADARVEADAGADADAAGAEFE